MNRFMKFTKILKKCASLSACNLTVVSINRLSAISDLTMRAIFHEHTKEHFSGKELFHELFYKIYKDLDIKKCASMASYLVLVIINGLSVFK